MKPDTVYNKPENLVMVRTRGNEIHVICNREEQMDGVVSRLTTPNCKLAGYEEWDDDEDRKCAACGYGVTSTMRKYRWNKRNRSMYQKK